MHSYNPQIKVLLIKAMHRTEMAPGIKAIQDRYQQLDSIDITPMLGDKSVVSVTGSTRQPSGTWTIRFADQPHKNLLETVYALIEPMDVIEIRMVHDITSVVDLKLPMVMRGFVSRIDRSESMSGNGPMRFVTVSGHNFAKALQLYRISYLLFTEMNKALLSDFKFFTAFAPNAEKRNMTGNEFASLVVDNIINPYMASFSYLSMLECTAEQHVSQWAVNSSISGTVSPYTVSSFTDESLYNVLRTVLDIGPFNEMYLEESEGAPVLVIRPTPFRNVGGGFIQGSADSIDISSEDIVAQQVSRSDEGVANYYWVSNNRAALQSGMDQQASAMKGSVDSFVKFNYLNSQQSIYGIRKMEVETVMGDEAQIDSSAPKADNFNKESSALLSWQERRRKLLADLNQDNVVFESGSLRLRGNERIKPGMYLNVSRGVNKNHSFSCYAHTVTHEFTPFVGFFTIVQFDRGNNFILRAQSEKAVYISEIEGGIN